MSDEPTAVEAKPKETTLESGTYEILRQRLTEHGRELRSRLGELNAARHEVFGSIETALVATDRVTTENNCLPRDLVAIGASRFLFGYNVHLGLRTETKLEDVFSAYEWSDRSFTEVPLDFLKIPEFLTDFRSLFKYYRETVFTKFGFIGPHLFMVFRVGKRVEDIKTFKWALDHGKFTYLGNRSDHEFTYPPQHEFTWTRTHRDAHRSGSHPHISVDDRLFVECIGGDLTIKIEDNTDSGEGIHREPVEQGDQTLDDAEIFYAILGNLILLRVRPYQEKAFRYFVFNDKLDQVHRIDAIEESCVLLPDDHGIIFSRGYYLRNGELRLFDGNDTDMLFERRIQSPNREDFLYIFYNRARGDYILMAYNVITQRVETPIHCNGFSTFENGELALFRTDPEPQKHHAVQIWQTPFTGTGFETATQTDSYLYKIGNAPLVRTMAECQEILALLERDDSYSGLYLDLQKRAGDLLDATFWLERAETFNLAEPLAELRDTSARTVDEFEKVRDLRRHAAAEIDRVGGGARELLDELLPGELDSIDAYVQALSELRKTRGELITLRDLRYADLPAIDALEEAVTEKSDVLSAGCVEFLLTDTALEPYRERTKTLEAESAEISKVVEGRELEKRIEAAGNELELLIEIVSNLEIADATETTRIVESISGIYASLNQTLARLRQRIRELQTTEGAAQFAAQLRLISQAVANSLERCDTPEKCDDFLGRLMVQVEELESRFAEFDEYLVDLAEKRTEIQSAFESKKLALIDARNRRAMALQGVADRLLKSIAHRVDALEDVSAINAFYASDQMVDRLRDVVTQLLELGDPVKSDDLQSRLKTIREDAVRQLRDRKELFVGGSDVIAFGEHHFNVNTQPVELTVLERDDSLELHLTGTRLFEEIEDEEIAELRPVWSLDVVSESPSVYRAEYLAHQVLGELEDVTPESVQAFMSPRYAEGYVKGVHDHDAFKILEALVEIHRSIGLMRVHPEARALAVTAWQLHPDENLGRQLASFGAARSLYPAAGRHPDYLARLAAICRQVTLFAPERVPAASEYLFDVLSGDGEFTFSHDAYEAFAGFEKSLADEHATERFAKLREPLRDDFGRHFELLRDWVGGFLASADPDRLRYRDEVVLLLIRDLHNRKDVAPVSLQTKIEGLLGQHPLIDQGALTLDYLDFSDRLQRHGSEVVPAYNRFQTAKRRVVEAAQQRLRTEEFKPRVLSSFVRNALVDKVFLPLIGANLAKQMGTAGENTRTDRMGLLLLISPPGYGKTTLMEYVADRLGVVFMKINGPSLGHDVTSLDPAQAPNAAAREELKKINLAFEMGDNVMIYLDDIQHCASEFLQKFISLCDGQRRIEGVHNGVARTYDLRGRKVAVVMAGNPYTESGEKFRIPDMLSNRADTYNLGDLAVGAHLDAFKLSYLENALTSNPILNSLATRSRQDIMGVIRIAETGDADEVDFEANCSPRELEDLVAVMKKLIRIRDVILTVNSAYIASAGQADAYRTEPPFLLQGSYRNMNRLAEKVVPVMNDAELEALIADHYRNEAQTLTTGAEANLLKLRELLGQLTSEEKGRWEEIKKTFSRNLLVAGGDENDPVSQVVRQLSGIQATIQAAAEKPAPALPASLGGSAGKRVAINPETLRKIWDLIENQEETDAPDTIIEVPEK
ncbi:MAG: DNA repair ATPase [Chthoniobacterales bacterium]